MTDAHWFVECMERGAKIVVIAPEYGAPSTKADYWIPIRPPTDAALWLGVTRLMMDNKWYDEAFVKRSPISRCSSARTTCKRLRAAEVFPELQDHPRPPTARRRRSRASPTSSTQKLGDFVVWDAQDERARRPSPATCRRDAWRRAALTRRSTGTSRSNWSTAGRSKWRRSGSSTRSTSRTTTSTRLPRSPARRKRLIEQLAQGHRDDQAGLDSSGRRHQPLVPRHRGESRRLSAADAHRQHRQARRGLPRLGRQLQGRAVPGQHADRPGLQRLGGRRSVRAEPRSQGARQGHPRARLHQGRGAGLLESRRPRRSSSTRRRKAARVFTGKTHMPTPTKAIFTQRQPDQQRQVGLRHDQERQPERGVDRDDGHADDRVASSIPTSACRPTRGSSSRIWKSPRAARIRSCKSGKAASSRSYDSQGRPRHSRRHRHGAGRTSPATSGSTTTSSSSTTASAASTSSACSTPAPRPPATSSTTSWPANTARPAAR